MNKEFKASYLEWAMENPGKLTDEELHAIIQIYFNFKIPNKRVCENHVAPFEFVADAFFERANNVIVMANRNGGKTQNFGILNALDTTFKGCEVASIGAIEAQAKKCYQYSTQCLRSEGFNKYLDTSLMSETRTTTGGILQVLPGTKAGVNSPHPQKANLDEVELMQWDILQEAMSMPKSSEKAKAALRITSTRKFSHGSMQRLLDEAEERHLKVYTWCIWEVVEHCPDERSGTKEVILDIPVYGQKGVREKVKVLTNDDIEEITLEEIQEHFSSGKYSGCLNCPLVEVCKTKAKIAEGYYSLEDTIDKFKQLDRETWNAQWECLTPGREGLVYNTFDEDIHVKEIKLDPSWRIYAGQDFGFVNPSVALFIAIDAEDNVYIFHEEYDTQQTIYNLAVNKYKKLYDKYKPLEWRCDTDPDKIQTMVNAGIPVAQKALTKDIDAGINVVRYFMRTPTGQVKLFIDPKCVNLINDFSTYHYKEGSDKPNKDIGDHGPDALRYILVSLYPQLLEENIHDVSSGSPYPDFESSHVDTFGNDLPVGDYTIPGYYDF